MRRAAAFLLLGLATAANAQPAPKPETVIVTGTKPHSGVTPSEISHDFVRSFATPTVLRDAIARWQTPICPTFTGIPPQYAAVMEAHFRTIAGEAGARVRDKGCRPNLWVVVTSQPQAYLDSIHARNVDILGYHGKTVISQPIQAWYMTGIQDNRGQVVVDRDNSFGWDPDTGVTSTNTAAFMSVGGWRFRPDLSSDLLNVTIIIDHQKIGPYMVGEVADYVAMMALSRTEDYNDCQLMPSITNLLSPGCDEKLKPDAITATDIAYLKGVYKMDAGAALKIQQDQIAGEMAKALGSGK